MVKKIKSVEDLDVFKKSHELTLDIYRVTEKFPQTERFGLINQMRRCSASMGTNLMEGGHRLSRKEFRHFVGISKGSAGELKYHLLLSKDLGYLPEDEFFILKEKVDQISMMLTGLVKSLTHTDTNH